MSTYAIVKKHVEKLKRKKQRTRVYHIPETSAFSLEDVEFKRLFCLSKKSVKSLCQVLQNEIIPRSGTRTAIPVEIKVLCTLRYFATASFQRDIGKDTTLNISQAAVSRSVVSVCKAIRKLLRHTIKFPSPSEYKKIKDGFIDISGFPGVIGVVGCSHVRVVTPPENDPSTPQHAFLNPKGNHSLNVLLVCDNNMKITYVNASYPGASMDWFVWKFSKLRSMLKGNRSKDNHDSWLIGNGNFQPETGLLTPYKKPSSVSEIAFNLCHKRTFTVMERCICLLKTRFKCLGWLLRVNPVIAELIIISCVILHNMCIDEGSDSNNEDISEENKLEYSMDKEDKSDVYVPFDESTNAATLKQQNRVVKMYFS